MAIFTQTIVMRIFSTKTNYALLKSVHPFIKTFLALTGKNPNLVLSDRMEVKWQLDLDEVIDLCIYLFGAFDKENILSAQKELRSDFTVLDIGANIGAFCLPIAQKLNGKGKIFAFEPSDYAFRKLSTNLELNPNLKSRIQPVQCFLSDKKENKTQEVYASWNMKSSTHKHQKHFGILTSSNHAITTTLDDIAHTIQLDRIDLVKIDADGAELKIVKGAKKCFEKFNPVIFIELCQYTSHENGYDLSELLALFSEMNYEFYGLNGKKLPKSHQEIISKIPKNGIMNAIAYPKK